MENTFLQNLIIEKFKFLINKYAFSLSKNEIHWLGGVHIEYEKNNIVISILYDKRESWFYCKLFSNENIDKAPLFFHTELINVCKLPNPIIPLDNDEEIINYINSLSLCLEKEISTILVKFEKGDYWK